MVLVLSDKWGDMTCLQLMESLVVHGLHKYLLDLCQTLYCIHTSLTWEYTKV